MYAYKHALSRIVLAQTKQKLGRLQIVESVQTMPTRPCEQFAYFTRSTLSAQ